MGEVFAGVPVAALDFYEDLEADNSKAFWQAHKHIYDAQVRRPLELLTALLAPKFGAAKIFRPYRDVRFAKDKTPYKDHQGAVVESPTSGSLYLHIDAAGLFIGGVCSSSAPIRSGVSGGPWTTTSSARRWNGCWRSCRRRTGMSAATS